MNEVEASHFVNLSVEIDASPATVWDILTDPVKFSGWMNGEVTFEAHPGSAFRAAFPNFETVVAGEIVTLDADARHLGITWGVESGAQADRFPAGSSLLEFRVHEDGTGCRVELTHRLPSAPLAHEHESGWRFHLSRMALFANRSDLERGLERSLPLWFAAWNETDPAARSEALEACCAAEVEFRDDWATARGTEALAEHIGNCFAFMPGWTIEATGDVRICRGEALVGWRSTGPDGTVEGHNHITADRDGTLWRVTGFQMA